MKKEEKKLKYACDVIVIILWMNADKRLDMIAGDRRWTLYGNGI